MLMGNLLTLKLDDQAVCMMRVFLQIVMFRKVTPQANLNCFIKSYYLVMAGDHSYY